jgi:ligand-binding SRPBCC domain-containing protein
MNVKIETTIDNDFHKVFDQFNLRLFKKLTPPLSRINVHRFDGCKTGDEVHVDFFLLSLFKQSWINKITSNESTNDFISFTDEGVKFPFPLKEWKHTHRIENLGKNKSKIVDDINYTTHLFVLDLLFYPLMKLMFLTRRPVYRRELNA